MSTHNMFLWRNKQNYPLIITKYPPYLFHWESKITVSLTTSYPIQPVQASLYHPVATYWTLAALCRTLSECCQQNPYSQAGPPRLSLPVHHLHIPAQWQKNYIYDGWFTIMDSRPFKGSSSASNDPGDLLLCKNTIMNKPCQEKTCLGLSTS